MRDEEAMFLGVVRVVGAAALLCFLAGALWAVYLVWR